MHGETMKYSVCVQDRRNMTPPFSELL